MARNSINDQINQVVDNLFTMLDRYNTSINKKTILKRAGKPAIDQLKQEARSIKRTGALLRSIQWINTRSRNSVFAGFNYRRGGSHAHLIEFGWITKNGNRVEGNPIVRRTYDRVKEEIFSNLVNELERTQAQIEREIRI